MSTPSEYLSMSVEKATMWCLKLFLMTLVGFACADSTELLPYSCVGLEDGTYLMQLIDDSNFPSVNVKCRNEYMILDYNYDWRILKYFSSWQESSWAFSPQNEDRKNWREWYLPDQGINLHNYLVSPDCNSCEIDNKNLQLYDKLTSYWITPQIEKGDRHVSQTLVTTHDCDMNVETDDCYYCQLEQETDNIYIGLIDSESSKEMYDLTGYCTHNIRNADKQICQTQECVVTTREISDHFLPSIGINGKFCVCVQPADREIKYFTRQQPPNQTDSTENIENMEKTDKIENRPKQNKEQQKEQENVKENVNENGNKEVVYELYQKDFADGTYRITKSGIYKIMENIEFDFNKNKFDNDDYNYINDDNKYSLYNYWPLKSQKNEYNGADSSHRDEYCLGFFAGISIECDDVIIDLNNYKLSMSFEFFHFQKWFTIIELSKQYFMPDSGIVYFGGYPSYSKNIQIKNGILGLSSHHGIHGNLNKNIQIENVQIIDFLTHGIQLNGFENVLIKNVEIGPSTRNSYFKPSWGNARISQRIWQRMADKLSIDKKITFNQFSQRYIKSNGLNAKVSMQDLVDELIFKMDIAWKFVLYLKDNGDTNWNEVGEVNEVMTNEDSISEVVNGFIAKHMHDDYGDDYSEEVVREVVGLFINPSGVNDVSAQYGIFLNKLGDSVLVYNYNDDIIKYGDRDTMSNGAVLENIQIHGLTHLMRESTYFRVVTKRSENNADADGVEVESLHYDLVVNPVLATINVEDMFNEYPQFDSGFPTYKGTILTDGYIASAILARDNVLGFEVGLNNQQMYSDIIGEWATVNDDDNTAALGSKTVETYKNMNDVTIGCNMDEVIHSGKGIVGLRIDSVRNVTIKNIGIYDLHDYTPKGMTICGKYNDTITNSDGFTYHTRGHLTQSDDTPQMVGFSGNMNQAISLSGCTNVLLENINIDDITSATGNVYGIAIWPATHVTFKGNKNSISNLKSGDEVEKNTFKFNQIPNGASETCGIRLYSKFKSFSSSLTLDSNGQINQKCFSGHVGCFGNDIQTDGDCSVTSLNFAHHDENHDQDTSSNSNTSYHGNSLYYNVYVQVFYVSLVVIVISFICCVKHFNPTLFAQKLPQKFN